MEKQKITQKEWYENKPPVVEDDVIQINTITHIKRLKDLFPVQEARLSLNCGCGRGGQENSFGFSIGMDISFENVLSLIQRGGQGVVADMEFLPFKDQTFDLVYGFGILHHLNDIRKGVSEAARVVRNGGYVGFGGENNGLCPFAYLMAFVYGNWKIEKGFHRIRERRLKNIFRESGINLLRFSRQGLTIYGLGRGCFQVTSLMEKILSKVKPLQTFSGYCYMAGRKS
jgi:SAM-dependent methyltransferase